MTTTGTDRMTGQSWEQTLGAMEGSVAQALDTLAGHQNALETLLDSSRAWQGADRSAGLEEVAGMAQKLNEVVEQAAASVADIDADLADSSADLRRWLDALAALRTRLSPWLPGQPADA